MSRSSYTSSERRGILIIAILALLLIGSGVVLSLCGRPHQIKEEIPVIINHNELIDSAEVIRRDKNRSNKKATGKKKSHNTKEKKSYRRRSPLDEPV